MKDKFTRSSYERLERFINNQTQNSESKNEVYLAAGGYYQDTYIAIFEDLTSNDSSSNNNSNISEANVDFIADLFINELSKRYPDKKFPFNKVLSVTLPSQIIAKALLEKLERSEGILYYTPETRDVGIEYTTELPSLIRLSSYYSYSEEIQFKNIVNGDKILLVNDVISTGNLIYDIYKNVIGSKNKEKASISISNVLAVVDSRIQNNEIKPQIHKRSIYFDDIEDFSEECFISLCKRKIYKFKENPHPNRKLIRINPILNSRITSASRYSEEDKVAFKDSNEFLELLPLDSLKIGHFSQNSLHHSYFITPNELFYNNPSTGNAGVRLIKRIVKEVKKIELKNDTKFHIKSVINQFDIFESDIPFNDPEVKSEIVKIKKSINILFENSKIKIAILNNNKALNHNLIKKTDYIFYPAFSGIEKLTKENIQDVFGVDYSNIFPLQRFDTNKGWRFIIPQNNYNRKLKNKKALILDMGSFTGDSIIQMIDALCVFELKKIIVISLVGRLEDFDREFFSRIREMKVNIYKRNTITLNESGYENTVAPVNIYFGTNLHIPAHLSSRVCEHCKELALLEKYKDFNEFKSTTADYYINKRIEAILPVHINNIEKQCLYYFPQQWNGGYDVLSFYTARDHLGKIDGYKFYTDYYEYFNGLNKHVKTYSKNMESIITVCLHEKHLINTIHNQLPDVKKKLRSYIKDIISLRKSFESLYYKWSVSAIVEFYFYINDTNNIFKKPAFNMLLNFIDLLSNNKKFDFSFVAFKMAENYYSNKKNAIYYQNELMKAVKDIWQDIEDNKNISYKNLITEFNRLIVNDEITYGNTNIKPFYTLFNIYDDASAYKPSHIELGTDVSNLKTILNRYFLSYEEETIEFNFPQFIENYDTAKIQLIKICDALSGVDKYLRSLIKLFKGNSFAQEYINGDKSLKKFLEKIDLLIKDQNDVYENLLQIYSILTEIEDEYFSISNSMNFYSIWKKTNYISIRDVWVRFRDNTKSQEDFFGKHVHSKDYSSLLKNRMKKFQIITEDSYRDVGVTLHPYLLIKLCKELLDNALQHSPGCSITIFLSSYENPNTNLFYSRFKYFQDVPAKGEPTNGLVDVQKILKDFNGIFTFSSNPKSLEIEISILNAQYAARTDE